jgi:hypothetical protein
MQIPIFIILHLRLATIYESLFEWLTAIRSCFERIR